MVSARPLQRIRTLKGSRFVIMLGGLAIAAAAVFALSRGDHSATTPPPATSEREFTTRPAGASESEGKVIALGRLEPFSRTLRINAPTGISAGRIAVLKVKEGDRVEQDQVLAVLDSEPSLAAAVAQAEATAEMKRAQLEQRRHELANSEKSLAASVEQQQAERDRAQWELDRLSHLKTAGLYSDPALIDKRLALVSANRRLETSRLALEKVQTRTASGSRLEEAVLEADIQAADAAAKKAKADHELASIRAPIAGRVLRLIGRLGQQVGSEGFAELGDTDVMMVRAEVFEADAPRITIGQPAIVTARALSGELHGEISRIGLMVGQQSIIREDPAAVLDSRVVEVLVRLNSQSSQRVAGLTNLQVRVVIARANGRPMEQTSHAN